MKKQVVAIVGILAATAIMIYLAARTETGTGLTI